MISMYDFYVYVFNVCDPMAVFVCLSGNKAGVKAPVFPMESAVESAHSEYVQTTSSSPTLQIFTVSVTFQCVRFSSI